MRKLGAAMLVSGLALGPASFVQCSAFTADEGTADASDGPTGDALADGGGDVRAADAPMLDASSDPCEGKPDAFELAGLYIIGGTVAGDAGGNGRVETPDILRAPVRCDGSLGAFVTLATKAPRLSSYPVSAALGDTLVYCGGQDITIGFGDSPAVFGAKSDGDGGLMGFTILGTTNGANRWRTMAAADGTNFLMLGGNQPSGAGNSQEQVATNETLRVGPKSFVANTGMGLPKVRSWGAAAVTRDRVMVFGGGLNGGTDGDILRGDIGGDGVVRAWTVVMTGYVEFDVAAVGWDGLFYVFGGNNAPRRFDVVKLSPDAMSATVFPVLNGVVAGAVKPATGGLRAAVARGFVYLTGALGTNVLYGKLSPAGTVDGFHLGPALPDAREQHTMVVF